MVQRRLAMLCLMAALAGCDEDPHITNVARHLLVFEEPAPPVKAETVMILEIHGLPWDGATPDEVANTMKMPEGPARTARFVAVAPGEAQIGGAERLVFQFNPPGPLDSAAICKVKGPLPVEEPRGDGFTVNAVYCRESEWLIQARMTSSAAELDWVTYHLAMEKLLGKMFDVE
jgi:hypothetical protein